MKLQIKRLRPDAKIPTRGSAAAAGYDLYACPDSETVTIAPHTSQKIGTGIAVAVPDGYFAAIFARSGLVAKEGLRPSNCVGVADSDYRGEYFIALHNDTDTTKTIHKGDRIAQMVVLPYLSVTFEEVDELDETDRGAGGFGSTGK